MKRCFGYVRVSTAKQGEGVSLDAQKEAITVFADGNDISIIKWFEEKETAAKKGRPIFNGMIRQLKAGKADGLVIHKIDRSARNFADWAKIGDLADAGIDVHFASESLDFRSRGGRLSADIQAVIAADYIRNLREETIKGITGRLKQGLYPFKAPIGYIDNGGGKPKTIDPTRGPLVKTLFELYASGEHSIWSLVAEMERRGLKTQSELPLSKSGVEKVLNNPFYTGIIEIKRTGQIFDGVHGALIPVTLFEQVQHIKNGKSGKKITRHNHLYRGLFRCGLCQSAMTPEKQKGYIYYRCQTRKCLTKTVREEKLEAAIHNLFTTHRIPDLDLDALDRELRMWLDERDAQKPKDMSATQLARIEDRLDCLSDKLIDRIIDDETYQTKKQKLFMERKTIEGQRTKHTKKEEALGNIRQFLERVKSLCFTYTMATKSEKREIVKIATSNRIVTGRNVYLEPRNWLMAVDNIATVLCGAPSRPTSRRLQRVRDQQFSRLIALATESETAEAMNFLTKDAHSRD
jgi:site-specific DNA recombinase